MDDQSTTILGLPGADEDIVGTDVLPFVDISDTTDSSGGTTKRSTWASLRTCLLAGLVGFSDTDDIASIRNLTASGTVTLSSLAGAGSRTVVAAADGTLSAP